MAEYTAAREAAFFCLEDDDLDRPVTPRKIESAIRDSRARNRVRRTCEWLRGHGEGHLARQWREIMGK